MSIAIYNKTNLVGGVTIDNDSIGWLYRGSERIGRVEVDWGQEDQEHMSSVYLSGNCAATVTLERYGRNVGKIMRGFNEIGQVRPQAPGVCDVVQGEEPIGRLESKELNVSGKHLILFGGVGAAVLLGLSTP